MKNNSSLAVGIIAEYNPFHDGHAYHIKKAKEMTQADYCIVAMSGDFVQRGGPAIYDKYTRTAMALSCGADLVIELPSVFASSSAEDFAACGIALLNNLGVVGSVCFGSECGNVEKLSGIASILATEPPVYTKELRRELKKGATFPQARNRALISCGILNEDEASILASPNNILGIEYCKALYRQKSPMTPVTISRKGYGYHDTSLAPEGFSSATGIRKAIHENPDILMQMESSLIQVPDPVKQMMSQGFPVFPDDFSALLNTTLLKLDCEGIPFEKYADVSEELAARLLRQLPDHLPFEEKINQLKTKQYTYTRISRALLHIALGVTTQQVVLGRNAGYAPYARILGFKKTSAGLMGEIKKRGSIPLITKTADARLILSGAAWSMLRQDFYCSHIYQTIVQDKYQIKMKNEFTHSVVIL
ncbi:nucleotidyltransferase [Clostridium sp. WB02_MRS01]|uniref:nucleotidyltransferase n=1 Tax=Clostridium sp. WB02_MRS01 TaxID=2605777 RepID=UPI0012B28C74|nr:nucleotidyltransferase [Clostridium sp. WB02_MRS01]MSS07169.1 nucleotidyltransferase [Clostridium sp. WB02_MRS01]